ncbi:MAG: hypothetical protein H7843_15775 [Nitrospirota bacterium]|uniref:Uncharacterized protein n=1 Tax=Candidatus Magnetominusculus xianensis TaxID=1748249 RepID=A0ABR5SG54_9BACT|nr:hypothetical protein [Candidatus Magnetominusculus xianensis]KWT87645.1 hypothetical protein ASN18_1322 [Candidatus Magnetominusculus xianensis]MBF0405666.1 hypothetical protein [Nitrospirota bacterium]
MNIPKKLIIGGLEYRVELVDPSFSKEQLGQIDLIKGIIKINKEITRERQESTLLHEIIEAINDQYQFQLEHEKIQGLEATLYQVLKDNNIYFGEAQ